MTKLLKYNLDGKKLADVEVDLTSLETDVHSQVIKDYIVALRKNQRQWSANTKGRTEVNHSNKKPHRQKGTGNARQGSLSAPQYKGGGVVFGPKPKFNQFVKINKKERQQVIKALLVEKIQGNHCLIVTDTDMEKPKTKTMTHFLKSCSLEKRVLFVGESSEVSIRELQLADQDLSKRKHFNLQLSIRNIPKIEFSFLENINGYQLLKAGHIVMTEAGLKQFLEQNKI